MIKHVLITLGLMLCASTPTVYADAAPVPAPTAVQATLTREGAQRVVAAAVAKARSLSAPGSAIAVVDAGGNLVALERLDGTFAAGSLISYGKARTAALFKKPTRIFEDLINKGRTAMTSLNDFTPLKGGVPIEMDGQIVGAVGVSGAASADQDDEIAAAAAQSLSASAAQVSGGPVESTAEAGKVEYFDRAAVEASFSKGAVLLDSGDRSYAVHTSRRVEPGLAEVHALETDVIHVLDGEATFVTGGKAINLKPTSPNEFRGTGIDGGESRTLRPGDVVVVPAGTPHWFKAVSGPFHYFVVKVRSAQSAAPAGLSASRQ